MVHLTWTSFKGSGQPDGVPPTDRAARWNAGIDEEVTAMVSKGSVSLDA
jgi:hypothetical protein